MMNKLPTKQIYLLSIIVFGIIALSIYSTYAIFTFEASTSDIFSINTPSNLSLSESTLKYKQVDVPKDSYITTDIDIYNNFDYDVCYSIWYKTDNENIKIYQNTTESITTSGVLSSVNGERVNILIINDDTKNAKVKIGLSYAANNDSCELNLQEDQKQIISTINVSNNLEKTILSTEEKNEETGYLTYKDITKPLTLDLTQEIKVASSFNYQDEIFTLNNPTTLTDENINTFLTNNNYVCLEDSCHTLYQIIETNNDNSITKYNVLKGYMKGTSGLRKEGNNYFYYGDNPNNFIYYNCINELDVKTCELWRIMGLTYDSKENKYLTKIIKDDYLLNSQYAIDSEAWNSSTINKYFTDEYKLTKYLKEVSLKQENIPELNITLNDIKYENKEYNTKIHLMSLSDYLRASICSNKQINEYTNECLTNNWLNKGTEEWTMTMQYVETTKDAETEEEIPGINNMIYTIGPSIEPMDITSELPVRPIVYLNNRLLVASGDGSFTNPYVIR